MLKESALKTLRESKNLLAFSAGGDSTALFFLLLDANIKFDIAIVNYNTREQSKEEVMYAQDLATKYNLNCYVFSGPKIKKNFEAKARELRYTFFEELITKHSYTSLLTAHHLGDRFEWMLMQFCKGAGCVELAGMKELEQRDAYQLIRPLLHIDKPELLNYLRHNNIRYFEDVSNKDEKYLRNSFRHKYAKPLLDKHLVGIKKSFQYLDEDKELLAPNIKVYSYENIFYFKSSNTKRGDISCIDTQLKKQGHLITSSEKELLKQRSTLVLGRKYLVSKLKDFILIVAFEKLNIAMSKEFKEECRTLEIDSKLRPFLYTHTKVFQKIKELLANS
ncbi:MAG: tRNA lysidine(34) synthetase TilS [Sulfurimonas sp.]|nr:tRNA lysidine(34) synthetase TilS [Sulfurimonas sp.]MDQ7059731.1 tRNA lysidine(34) synthetase TilS [Sulfurimonas sp.]